MPIVDSSADALHGVHEVTTVAAPEASLAQSLSAADTEPDHDCRFRGAHPLSFDRRSTVELCAIYWQCATDKLALVLLEWLTGRLAGP